MSAQPQLNGQSAKVLVVEDTADIRDVLAEILADEGYEVTTAENGAVALEQLRRDAYDLMLLDLMMPVVDGIQVLETLEKEGCHMPVIAMSAFERFRSGAGLKGVRAFLVKPVGVEQLLDEVAAAVEA